MEQEQGQFDWTSLAATVAGVLASAALFVGLYAALTLPVVQTLDRL